MEYSRRTLTHRRDILYTLSGVAERMYMYINAPYLAGFWADRFLETLVWTVSTSTPSSSSSPSLRPLPKEDAIPEIIVYSCGIGSSQAPAALSGLGELGVS